MTPSAALQLAREALERDGAIEPEKIVALAGVTIDLLKEIERLKNGGIAAGDRFGMWTAIERDKSKRGAGVPICWVVLCDCGTTRVLMATSLRQGDTKSCGCSRLKHRPETRRFTTQTHGECVRANVGRSSAEYTTWRNMKRRCTDDARPEWKNYGGRGIKVCAAWDESFEAFLADMGRRPSPKHTIDRINNDGDYEPGNCRWVTRLEQNYNTRSTKLSLADKTNIALAFAAGESTKTLASHYGVSRSHIQKVARRWRPNATGHAAPGWESK